MPPCADTVEHSCLFAFFCGGSLPTPPPPPTLPLPPAFSSGTCPTIAYLLACAFPHPLPAPSLCDLLWYLLLVSPLPLPIAGTYYCWTLWIVIWWNFPTTQLLQLPHGTLHIAPSPNFTLCQHLPFLACLPLHIAMWDLHLAPYHTCLPAIACHCTTILPALCSTFPTACGEHPYLPCVPT